MCFSRLFFALPDSRKNSPSSLALVFFYSLQGFFQLLLMLSLKMLVLWSIFLLLLICSLLPDHFFPCVFKLWCRHSFFFYCWSTVSCLSMCLQIVVPTLLSIFENIFLLKTVCQLIDSSCFGKMQVLFWILLYGPFNSWTVLVLHEATGLGEGFWTSIPLVHVD